MSTTAKVLLTLSALCLGVGGAINTGLVNSHELDALYIILPVGAVFLGLFLIVLALPKEETAVSEGAQMSDSAAEHHSSHTVHH